MKSQLLKLQELMTKSKVDALLVSSIPNIVYLTGYSGFSKDEREAYLFIVRQPRMPARQTNKTSEVNGYIITDGRYSEAVLLHIPHFQLIERTITNTLDDIFKHLAKKHNVKKLGIEENNITVAEHKLISKCFNDLPTGKAGLNHFSMSNMRSVKDASEISFIEQACKLGDKTFDYILTKIKKGVSEKELAFELENFVKKAGADLSFPTIVAFGKNSSIPHHQSSNQQLATSHQFVLLDFGVKLNNYCSDMTRTVFFGKATKKQKKIYETVLMAQKKAIRYLKSSIINHKSINASNVDKVARDYIISQGYPTIPHSLGHGIGIEVHEAPSLSPNSKDVLKEGMVFSVEPGIYLPAGRQGIPGFGGVRIEDLVVLEKSGPRLLTKSPRQLLML